jgi:Mrp family chromosome partitioning ATPase
MARFLKTMKHAESGQRSSTPADEPVLTLVEDPPFTLHVAPAIVEDFPDDDVSMPYIEVGPRRSVEGSPDVLAFKKVPVPVAVPAPVAAANASAIVKFRPLPAPVVTPAAIAAEVIAYHTPDSAASAQYRDLLAAILSATSGAAASSLLFTGSAAGVGTTTVVLNLAVTAARQGRRVAVVDVNARRPAVAARLALCDRPGLGEVLAGTATLDEAVQETEQPGLAALTSGGPAVNAPRAAESYRSLLRQLRQRYDLVLVDGPRWEARPDVIAPGVACDATFLVLPAGADETPVAADLLRQLPANGVHLAGSIVAAR